MTLPCQTLLDEAGLNLQAVFDLSGLPPAVRATLAPEGADPAYRQAILLGHGGRRLWEAVKAAGLSGADPIDCYSEAVARQWFAQACPGHRLAVLYPGNRPVGLQALGTLAGWHHPSPFMVGINGRWGSWFAYRVLLLADTELPTTPPLASLSPCQSCGEQPCIGRCPADALADGAFHLDRCVAYRKQADSRCRLTCLARLACPVAAEHRYEPDQLRHTYAISLATIEQGY